MQRLPTILLILSFPAGIVGYIVGAALMSALPLPAGVAPILSLFVPLFVAGLFMLPFLVKWFDRRAQQDLAAYRASQAAAAETTPDQSPPP